MHRARRVALAAFVLIWSVAALVLADPPAPVAFATLVGAAPTVAWPPSSGLLIAEVVTGGASASDEYIELTNAGPAPVDLNGVELAYASSAGASAVRRATWTAALLLDPGRHLLIANAAGIFAAQADATYTAGIAATGGALVLRPVGGTPIDAVGWGDATNAFVETETVAAPPAGSSIERRPGGSGGNVSDTNDNATDWSVNPAPRPRPGASPSPTAHPSASPSASARSSPTPSPSPVQTPRPSPSPSDVASASPSPHASPSPTPKASATPAPKPPPSPSPSPSLTAQPSPTPSPSPSSSPSPTAKPSLSPSPTASLVQSPSPSQTPPTTSIAEALRSGGQVAVAGIVTAGPTLIDSSGRLVVIQDSSGAIEVHLPAAGSHSAADLVGHQLVPGARLHVDGSIGRAYGAPRLNATNVSWLGLARPPLPFRISTAPGVQLEWRLVVASGRLEAIHKLGQRWRADLIVGSTRIPIAGLTGAQIAVGRLFLGRLVTVVGIVRRAYPSAADQRFAIDPRSLLDLAFEPASAVHPAPTARSSNPGPLPGSIGGSGSGTAGAPAPSGEPTVNLRDLGSMNGRRVQVGGLVTGIVGSMVSIDDGTAIGRLLLSGEAAAYVDLVEDGDPIEVIGRVETDATGPYLLVTDANAVTRAGDPGAGTPGAAEASPPVGGATNASGGPAVPASRQIDPGTANSQAAAPESIGLLEGLGLALIGAILALAIVLPLARRGARAARPGSPEEGPRARPTLGPS